MIEATSCGGVVIFRGKILLLYKNYKNKYEGWVLPKGTVEDGEEFRDTATREVLEETGAAAMTSEKTASFRRMSSKERTLRGRMCPPSRIPGRSEGTRMRSLPRRFSSPKRASPFKDSRANISGYSCFTRILNPEYANLSGFFIKKRDAEC